MSNTDGDTSTTDDANRGTTITAAEMIEQQGRRLHEMIEREKWDGAMQMLLQSQGDNTDEGRDIQRGIVLSKDRRGQNTFQHACKCSFWAPPVWIDVLLKLIEIGGRDIVWDKDEYGRNGLHCVCSSSDAPLEIVSKLIEVGGRDIIHDKNINFNREF